MKEVTDPALIEELNSLAGVQPAGLTPGVQPDRPAGELTEVTDPTLLEELDLLSDIEEQPALERGFSGGLRSLGSIGGGALAAAGDVIKDVGNEFELNLLKNVGGDIQQYGINVLQDYQKSAQMRFGHSPTLEQVFESDEAFDDFMTWVGVNVGQGAATTLPALASFLVNPALGWTTVYGMGVGEVYGEQLSENNYQDAVVGIALAAGVPYALAERAFGAGANLANVIRKGGSKEGRRFLRRLAAEVPKAMFGEATAEALQQAIVIGGGGLEAGKSVDEIYTWDALKEIGEAGAAGGIAGGPFGAVSAIPADRARPSPPGILELTDRVPDEPAPTAPKKPAAAQPQAGTTAPPDIDPATGIARTEPPLAEEPLELTEPLPTEPTFTARPVRQGTGAPIPPGTPAEPGPVYQGPTAEDMAAAGAETEPEPSPAQIEADNYPQGKRRWNGLELSIETRKGGVRRSKPGVTPAWEVDDFPAHYGKIKRTEGADGEHVDFYMGENPESPRVFLVDQVEPEDGAFDEHKAMLGFSTQDEAMAAYSAAFSDGTGPDRIGNVIEMDVQAFKNWLRTGDTKAPAGVSAPEPKPAPEGVTTPPEAPSMPPGTPSAAPEPSSAAPEAPSSPIGTELEAAADEDIDALIAGELEGIQQETGPQPGKKPFEYTREEVRRMAPEQVSEMFWAPAAERIYRLAGTKNLQGIADYYSDRYNLPKLKIEKTKDPIKVDPGGGVSMTHGSVSYVDGPGGRQQITKLQLSDTMSPVESVMTLRHEIEHMIDIEAGYETDVEMAVNIVTDQSGRARFEVTPGHHRYFEVFNYDYPHRIAIRDALEAGEQVPEEVLRDYPELVQQEQETEAAPEEAAPSEYGTPENPNIQALGKYFYERFVANVQYGNIIRARKEAAALVGGPIKPDAVEEAVELGVVMTARRYARISQTPENAYENMMSLYQRQPILGTRTSTSVEKQQYSTPVPLAYLVSRLAGVKQARSVYEPTAGNGALLIEANRDNAIVNELDQRRAENLRAQGFEVTTEDAYGFRPSSRRKIDAIVMNPPFGKAYTADGATRYFSTPFGRTTEIDHAIATMALPSMQPDGKAVIILGSKAGRDAGTSNAYKGRVSAAFYKHLYDNYNVTDHFVVSGDLYKRQGASFPVDVIVIQGKGRSQLAYPHGKIPPVLDNWQDIKGLLDGQPANRSRREAAAGGERPEPAAGGRDRPEGTPTAPEDVGVPRPVGGAPAPGDRGGAERPQPAPGLPEQRPGGAPGAPQPAPEPVGERPPQPERPSPQRPGDIRRPPTGGETERPAPVAPRPEPGGMARPGEQRPDVTADDALEDLFGEFEKNIKAEEVVQPKKDTEDLYAKLKERLTFAYERGVAEGWTLKEFVQKVMAGAKGRYEGEQLEAFGNVVSRFLKDVRDGRIQVGAATGEEQAVVDEADELMKRARKAAQAAKEAKETEFQVKYQPVSGRESVDTLLPKNHLTSLYRAQQNLIGRLRRMPAFTEKMSDGEILDRFVAGRLGLNYDYVTSKENPPFSGEQIDAIALAIDNHERGGSFILGDQTGVGKGRVVAGMMMYAKQQGMIPIFVTENPGLYGDIYRDLHDISWLDFTGLPTNRDLKGKKAIPLPPEDKGLVLETPRELNAFYRQMIRDQKLPKGYDALLTTYTQLQPINKEQTPRNAVLRSMAPKAFLVLDESHEAGGTEGPPQVDKKTGEIIPTRSDLIREYVRDAKGVMYSSATFAKRPQTMSLYQRTNMRLAVENPDQLQDILAAGGVPMEQVMSSMLVEDAQYVRREKDFDGITIPPVETPINVKMADENSRLVREIFVWDQMVKPAREKFALELLTVHGGQSHDGDASKAQTTSFGSLMHNVVAQSLLGLKVDSAADMAIEAHKAGRKPIITVSNTMGAILTNYMQEMGIEVGQDFGDLDFREVYKKYLNRTIEVTLTDPITEAKRRFRMTAADMLKHGGPTLVQEFQRLGKTITASMVRDMPASPIDSIIKRLEDEGLKVGEITGRGMRLDLDDRRVVSRETGPGQKKRTIADFNNGKIDAVIMNRSGSTGFSMHAHSKFRDQRPRKMINAQPEANIDKYVQLLGRINRTGQVELPEYAVLVGDIPAEIRPAAVLAKKLASLNANTAAARKTAITTEAELDLMNKVGAEAVATYLLANLELAPVLGLGSKDLKEGVDLVQKVTGRLAILPVREGLTLADGTYIPSQSEFYDGVADIFNDVMEQYQARGENPLEAQTMDLEAETLESSVLAQPKPSGLASESIFEAPANIEKVMANRVIKPLTRKQVIQRMYKAVGLDGDPYKKTELADEDAILRNIAVKSPQNALAIAGQLQEDNDKYKQTIADQITQLTEFLEAKSESGEDVTKAEANRLTKMRVKFQQRGRDQRTISRKIQEMPVGREVKVQIGKGEGAYFSNGIIIDFRNRNTAKDPLSLSNFEWTVALVEGDASTVRLKGTQVINLENKEPPILFDRAAIRFNVIMERMERAATVTREERFLITGNLVAGFNKIKKGSIITYTTAEGDVRQGVLLPRAFEPSDLEKLPAALPESDHVMKYLAATGSRGVVESTDNMVKIVRDTMGHTVFRFKVKGGRRLGTSPALRKAILGDPEADFTQRKIGSISWWIGNADSIQKAKEAIDILIDTYGMAFNTQIEKPIARNITGESTPGADPKSETYGGATIRQSRFTKTYTEAAPDVIDRITKIGKRIAPGVKVKVVRELFYVAEGKRRNMSGAYYAGSNVIAVAMGNMGPENALRHEAVHALKEMGLFTDREWQILNDQARRIWNTRYNIDQLYGNLNRSERNEESIAQAFADWNDGAQFAPGFRKIFDKLAKFLHRVGNALRGLGFDSYYDIFERVEAGEVGLRTVTQPRGSLEARMQKAHINRGALESFASKIGRKDKTWKERLGEVFETGFLDRIAAGVADDLQGLKLMEMVANAGKLFEDARSAYKLARLSRGVGEVVFEAMFFGAPIWNDGTTDIDTTVKAPMQILDELEQKYGKKIVADFEMYMAARRAEELMQPSEKFPQGREKLFPPDEVAAVLELAEVYPEFVGAFAQFQTYNSRLLDFVQQSGLLDAKTRALFEEMHKNYVPFFRIMENDGKGKKPPSARLGFAGQHPNFYRLKGSEKNIEHPLLNWENNVHRLIEASVKNVVMLRAEQLNAQTGGSFMTVRGRTSMPAMVNNRQIIKDLEAQGLEITPEDRVDPNSLRMLWSLGHAPKGDNIVSWVRGGKPRFAEVHEPMLFRAFTMLHRKPIPLLGPFRAAKQLLTTVVGIEPTFQVRNFVRDTLHASVISHIGFKPGIDSIRGMWSRIANDKDWKDFVRGGGAFGTVFESERPSVHKVVEREIKGKGHRWGTIIDTPRGLIGAIQRVESTFEYSTRVGAFKKLRGQGKSRMEAAYQAREISTDFSMRGYWLPIRVLTETVPFLNAGIQGLYRTERGAAENPWSFTMKGLLLASLSIGLFLLNRDDERFKALPDYERDNYWHFFIGDSHYKMPKPFEVGAIFGSIPERMAELALEREGKRFADRMYFIMTEMFRLDPIPQLVKPPLRIYANWDEFRDRPVIPPWLERVRPEHQYDSRTPQIVVDTGKLLKQSPKEIETLINGYLGAVGTYATVSADTMYTALGGYPDQPGTWFDRMGRPVVRGFIGKDTPNWTRYLDEFYKMKVEVDELYASMKHLESQGAVEEVRELVAENRSKLAMRDALNRFNKQLRQINRTMQAVRYSKTLDSDQKKERLERLQDAKNRTAQAAARLRPAFAK